MEIHDIDPSNFNALRGLAAGVVDGLLAGRVPPYIDRDELIGDCISKLPSLLAEHEGRNGAALTTFLKKAWRHDALNFIDKERRKHKHIAEEPLSATGARETNDDDSGSFQDRAEYELQRGSDAWHGSESYRHGIKTDVFTRARNLLTPAEFEALSCCYYAGVTEKMAAQKLGTTRDAIHSRLGKALRKLRKDFNDRPHVKEPTLTVEDFF